MGNESMSASISYKLKNSLQGALAGGGQNLRFVLYRYRGQRF
jgi:hypothetical protein